MTPKPVTIQYPQSRELAGGIVTGRASSMTQQDVPIPLPPPLDGYLVTAAGDLIRAGESRPRRPSLLRVALKDWSIGRVAVFCRCTYPGVWELVNVGDRPPRILERTPTGERSLERPGGPWWHSAAGLREVVLESFTDWPGVTLPAPGVAVGANDLELPRWLSSESRSLLRGRNVDHRRGWHVIGNQASHPYLLAGPVARDWFRNQTAP